MTRNKNVEAFLPMTPAMFHVLIALADGEKHGYAILKEVARRTEDKVRLSAGTLYGNLARLESSGLIVESDARPAIGLDDERRRYYRMKPLGERTVRAEAQRIAAALAAAKSKRVFVGGKV